MDGETWSDFPHRSGSRRVSTVKTPMAAAISAGATHKGEAKINPASVADGCLTGGVQSMEFEGQYTLS